VEGSALPVTPTPWIFRLIVSFFDIGRKMFK